MRDFLELLEARGGDGLAISLAWLAGRQLEHDPEELNATIRRATLLLATGGDPRREPALDDHAVTSVAADLGGEAVRERFDDALRSLATEAEGMASVASALAQLRAQPDLAWRCYACALLAEAIGAD
jgi:hypothetical protein